MKALAQKVARDRLISFMVYTDQNADSEFRRYSPQKYHYNIAEKLEAVSKGEINKLIIALPPQHGKSTEVSVNFPAWSLGNDPSLQIGLATYGAELSESFSRKTRDLMRSAEYMELFDTRLKDDTQGVKEWATNKMGRFIATGVGGALTGKGLDIGLIDDPLKDRKEADSQLIRSNVWDWYTSVFLSRLHVHSKQIVIMTRWHEDDLVGRLLDVEGDKWTVVNIPVYEGDDTIWPVRFPKEFIDQKRIVSGERDFQSLYMGNPVNVGGGAFKNDYFEYYHLPDVRMNGRLSTYLRVFMFVDPAIALKQESDYTAITTIGVDDRNNNIYVLDIFRERVEPDNLIEELFSRVIYYQPEKVGVENVAYQKMLILEIRKQMGLKNRYFTMEEVKPMGEKEARITSTLQARYSNHKIYHLQGEHTTRLLEEELLKFPVGKHDDIIDSLSGAVSMADISYHYDGPQIMETDYI